MSLLCVHSQQLMEVFGQRCLTKTPSSHPCHIVLFDPERGHQAAGEGTGASGGKDSLPPSLRSGWRSLPVVMFGGDAACAGARGRRSGIPGGPLQLAKFTFTGVMVLAVVFRFAYSGGATTTLPFNCAANKTGQKYC